MRREGSPWRGLGVVTRKELSDHLSSVRMLVIELLVVVTGVVVVLVSLQQIRDVTAEDPFLLLRVFTRSGEQLSFVFVLTLLVPLIAIGLGFDLVNSEHNQRTLSRILSQPIYRDALLFGKFLAGLATIAISLTAMWMVVIGLALAALGVPPNGEELARAALMLVVTIAYAGVWLALAMLFSVLFRSAATAALARARTVAVHLDPVADPVEPPGQRVRAGCRPARPTSCSAASRRIRPSGACRREPCSARS